MVIGIGAIIFDRILLGDASAWVSALCMLAAVLALAIGALFLAMPGRLARLAGATLYLIACTVFIVAALEGALHLWFRYQSPDRSKDDYYGWRVNPDMSVFTHSKAYGNVHYTTVRDGFRLFENDAGADAFRIFVLGDSFTQAKMITNGKTYYDYLAEHIPGAAMFVYGAGGYGSLQEYMYLDEFIDEINPDLIVWQFCGNDIINNDFDLESASIGNNNRTVRPYWIDGDIEWRFPRQNYGWKYNLTRRSNILKMLNLRLETLKVDPTTTIEQELHSNHPLFLQAKATTTEIMKMARARSGDVPFVAFSANAPIGSSTLFKEVCEEAGIRYVPNVPQLITAARESGVAVDFRPHDTHWNDRGHALAGKAILAYLQREAIVSAEETDPSSRLDYLKAKRVAALSPREDGIHLEQNGSFEIWSGPEPFGWTVTSGILERSDAATEGDYALHFARDGRDLDAYTWIYQVLRHRELKAGSRLLIYADAQAFDRGQLGLAIFADVGGKHQAIPLLGESGYGWMNHAGGDAWETLHGEVVLPAETKIGTVRLVLTHRSGAVGPATIDNVAVLLVDGDSAVPGN